jgi:mono/diheme cytochrome c family protein
VFSAESFVRVTNDRFFISIDASDRKFEETNTRDLLSSLGAGVVEICREPAKPAKIPAFTYWAVAILAILACFPPLVVAWMRAAPSSNPRIQIFKDMDSQPSFKAQTISPFFEDLRSNRPAIPGTIARGRLGLNKHYYDGQVDGFWVATFPESIQPSEPLMKRGQERYNIYCAPCHGLAGDGDGMTAQRALRRAEPDWRPPTQIYAPGVLEQPLGQIYNTIKNGKGTMPAYDRQIPVEDRWAIVMYVKALQRSRTASIDDVPEGERAALE